MTRSLRILLIQVREAHDPMRAHEVACFAERAGLPSEAVVPFDAVQRSPSLASLRGYDAVFVGGSGVYNVSERNQPGLERLFELLRQVSAVGHPTFASCYGFQCLVAAHGGEVIYDPDRGEVGTYRLELTEAGRCDPVLGILPDTFDAQQGHKDRAARLPEGFENLAFSERSPLQAVRVPNQPVWGVQFHPELDHVANRQRYEHYLDLYAKTLTPEQRAHALDRYWPTPDASSLLRRFLELL